MDLLSHIASGIAIGTVAASFSKNSWKEKLGIVTVGGFGGALPDFDAISLWSKFDATIGRTLHLSHSGKDIYFSKLWYSHHAFLHSISAVLLIGLIIGIFSYIFRFGFNNLSFADFTKSIQNQQLYLTSFMLGFTIHLFEDMPTPYCVWGGVNFFWPSNTYLGGTGQIWWWNNYDIFLIIIAVIMINILILCVHKLLHFDARKLTVFIFLIGALCILRQINTRGFDFNYIGFTSKYDTYEAKSKKIQQKILGDKVYRWMVKFDKAVKLNF